MPDHPVLEAVVDGVVVSKSVQYVGQRAASEPSSQAASASRSASRRLGPEREPAHAVTASEEDSWLLPSANSPVPAAHEWDA